MLEIENISHRYGGSWVLQSVSFQLCEGERLAVVGPSGVGKSSLLRLIAGLEEPVSGQVRIAGQAMDGVPPHERGLSLMTQQATLFPHWTVRQNLELGLANSGVPGSTTPARMGDLAEKLGIADLLDRKPVGLSVGQQKRVALGRALIGQSRLLLLDEPFSSLDSYLRLNLASELSTLLDQSGAAAILVTHDVAEALSFGDRLLVLLDGRIAQTGAAREVYRRPASLAVARFLGDPPCSLMQVRLEAVGNQKRLVIEGEEYIDTAQDRIRPFTGLAPGPWWAGIRPEHLGLFRERPTGVTPNTLYLPVTVTRAMLRGPATLVEISLGASIMRAWTPPDARWEQGQQAVAALDLGRTLWFDQATGQLAPGPAGR